MHRFLVGLALVVALATGSYAQESAMSDTIHYTLGWENPASQLYTVTATAPANGEPLLFSLPAWRPGRYIVQNYASNVQSVRAHDQDGAPLRAVWDDIDSWRVDPGDASEVTLAYEYYATTHDAGSSTLRPDLAYFNPVNLFPWVEGRTDAPVELTLAVPPDWDVATQLEVVDNGDGPRTLRAPHYHRFVDSPTIAAPEITTWSYEVDDVPFRMMFSGRLRLGERTQESIVADVEALSREQMALFGGAPFDAYTHLYQMVPRPIGHAVEHEASASYVLTDGLFLSDQGYNAFLSVTSHELFHAWNVKRIRPAALWPYDYSTPQLTRNHWVTEGITSYYEDLFLVRGSVITPEQYFQAIGDDIRALERSHGRKITSAAVASLTSWHSGYGDGNPNQSVSFYTKGAVLGVMLDMRIRNLTDGARGLDDVMRHLWSEYYERGRGYPEDGFQRAIETVAGASFDDFFARYVYGVEEIPYAEHLSVVGLTARETTDASRPATTIGIMPRPSGNRIALDNVFPDSPALAAGLMRGDVLVSVGGVEISTSADIVEAIKEHRPGDVVDVVYERDGEQNTAPVTLAGGANLRWVVESVENPTERQLRLREGWLASLAE